MQSHRVQPLHLQIMQQAVDYLLKIRPQLSSLLASYNLTSHGVGTIDDSRELRHRWVQQRGALITALSSTQANFRVVIEAQKKRTSREPTLFQLCSYYLAFLDFALQSFERGQRLLMAYPEAPQKEPEMRRFMGMEKVNSVNSSSFYTTEKERADLMADVTTIKLFRNTVRLLQNRLRTGHAMVNRVPRLFPIAQAIISRHKACRLNDGDHRDSTWSEWSLDTLQAYEPEHDRGNGISLNSPVPLPPCGRMRALWTWVNNRKLLAFSSAVATGVLLSSIFIIAFVLGSIETKTRID